MLPVFRLPARRTAFRLVSLGGSTLDVTDEAANDAAFGWPEASRASSANPQLGFVSLVENGTLVLFGRGGAPGRRGRAVQIAGVL